MSDRRQEIQEAIQAANRALDALRRADGYLSGARRWGVADMLGGGMFTTLMKRGRMADADAALASARNALQAFARELRDVQGVAEVRPDTDGFLKLADYFWDGLAVDWMVQSRIANAQRRVAEAIARVEGTLNRLQSML